MKNVTYKFEESIMRQIVGATNLTESKRFSRTMNTK